MIKTRMNQAWQVMKQNAFFSTISILSTAVTITFVMVAYMAYDLSSSDLAPETNRSRLLYSDEVSSFRTKDHSHVSNGMSLKTARAITEDLPSVEAVSLHTRNWPFYCQAVGAEGVRERRRGRFVDIAWWTLFDYEFIAGRPFLEEEYMARKPVAVITERVARETFQTTDVVGREMLVNFLPYTICGVVKDVSSQFSTAYCDFWANLTAMDGYGDIEEGNGSERVSGALGFIALASKGKRGAAKEEIERGNERFNQGLIETTLSMKVKTHTEYTFLTFFNLNPALVYVLLACIFLIVPAINISGLIFSMLDKRFEEVGIRKVYGASKTSIVNLFLSENLLLILVGGIVGLLLSFLTIYLFKNWLLGVSVAYASTLNLSWWMFFRPSVFLSAFVICLLFNLLSTFIPIWYTSGKNIIATLKGN